MATRSAPTSVRSADDGAQVRSVSTALTILDRFADSAESLGVSEIAQACGLNVSQVSKVLATFAESGMLVQDAATRRYSVGPRLYAIGSRHLAGNELCHAAMPILRDLTASTGHSSRLSVPDGDRVLFLVGVEGPMFIDTGWRSGTRMPLHATAAGRVMLAFADAVVSESSPRAPLPALTDRTVVDRRKLDKLVTDVRRNGYAIQHGESVPDLTGAAVPLFGARRRFVGTLSVVMPSHLFDERDAQPLRDSLHRGARMLSQRVGCDVYPFGR
ncbi:IclR family transcriptional regulator [soil metagenome]